MNVFVIIAIMFRTLSDYSFILFANAKIIKSYQICK
nr:MAG TPA: hypothetical protein [Caudoviricetes sp.]